MNREVKSIASVSLDLDNEWSYMQTAGNEAWSNFPTYLPEVVPRILNFFRQHDTRITFFIVGRDAEDDRNHGVLRNIVESGHEIGNHSFGHQPWLHCFSRQEIDTELETAENAIRAVTGVTPRVFRGPGYSYSASVLDVLRQRDYICDCTSFPNSTAALSRAYLFSKRSFQSSDRSKRSEIFGKNSEVFRPLKPYKWNLDEGSLIELPVTTMPLVRVPFHFSYILYLAQYSRGLALAYFRTALALCRLFRVEPSLLFHPLDFMGSDDKYDTVSFFPGMNDSSEKKVDVLNSCMALIKQRFEVVTIGSHADRIASRSDIRSLNY